MFDNLPIRRIKNIIAIFLMLMSLIFMWYVYTDDISYIAKQQSDNYKSEAIEFGGNFNTNTSTNTSGMQFREEIEVEDEVEEEVEEDVYKHIEVSIWNFVKFGLCTILFGFVVAFMCVSKAQNEPFLDTFKKGISKVLLPVVTLILTIGLTTGYCVYIVSYVSKLNEEGEKQVKEEAKIKFDGVYKLEGEKNKKYKGTYKSIVSDESVFIVGNKASIQISEAVVDKSGIDCFNNIYSKNYGMNAAILAIENGKADIKSSNVYSDTNGGTALFATGKDAYISGKNTKVVVLGNASAYAVATSYSGKVELEQMDMVTNGNECAVLMAGRSGGEISIQDSALKSFGECAPIAHIRGTALLKNINGESKESYVCSIENGGSIQIDNSNIMAGMKGYNRNEDGLVIVKSESTDYENRKPAIVSINNSVLQGRYDSDVYNEAAAFVITNAETNINLKNTEIGVGSKILFDLKAISGIGKPRKNGGHASIITDSQKLVGFVKVDEDSSLKLKLTNGTGFVGGINYLNSGSEKVELSLDSSSRMILTTHCYLTKFENEDQTNSNINFGRFKIFVNGKAIN